MLSLWDELHFHNNLLTHRIQACVRPAAVFRVFPEISGSFQEQQVFPSDEVEIPLHLPLGRVATRRN